MIEGTLTILPEHEKELREHNIRLISFRMGNDLILDIENFVYKEFGCRAFYGTKYDAIWISPHLMKTNAAYTSIMYNAPVEEAPHLWSPRLLEEKLKSSESRFKFGYKPNRKKKKARIGILEPNISVVKNCFIPILITEKVYQEHPEKIEHVYVCNSVDKKDRTSFHNFVGVTNIVKDNVLTAEGRFFTPLFMAEHADLLVTHQWECGLNYLYYEIIYGNYPIVHNSEYLKDANIGFFYPEFDALEGAEALLEAIDTYDVNFESHQKRNETYVESLLPTSPNNVLAYKKLIENVLKKE